MISASSGSVGGWAISSGNLLASNISLISGAAGSAHIFVGSGSDGGGINSATGGGAGMVFWAGASHANRATAAFRVTANGALVATNASITGSIFANSGELGTLEVNGVLTIDTGGSIVAGGVTLDSGGLTLDGGTEDSKSVKWPTGGRIHSYTSGGTVLRLTGTDIVVANSANHSYTFSDSGLYSVSATPTLGLSGNPWGDVYLSTIGSVSSMLSDHESRIAALENP